MEGRIMRRYFTKITCILLSIFLISGCSQTVTVSEDNVNSYTIEIPGVEKEYEFLYLTDTHIIVPDEKAEKQILDYSRERLNNFTSQNDFNTGIRFTDWIDYANTSDFDGLLLGGDIIDSPSASNLSYLDSSLAKLHIPYVYTIGNHDWTYPWEYMTEQGKKEYLPLLSLYMEDNPVIHTKEYEDFTIVAIDNSSNQINPAALEEYKNILAKEKPVILMLHVPLYTESVLAESKEVWQNPVILGGGIHGGIYPDAVSTEFLHLTTAKDSPVAAVLAGHVHFADKDTITGEKTIPQIVGDAGFKGKGTRIRIVPANKIRASKAP